MHESSNVCAPRRSTRLQSRIDRRSTVLFHLLSETHSDKDIPAFSINILDYNPSGTRSRQKTLQNNVLDLALPTLECKYFGALFWHEEALHRVGRKIDPAYSLCCQDGQVEMALLQETPPLLDRLLSPDGDALSRHYQKHIRSYNAAFSWTSFGAKFSQHLLNSRETYSLVLYGENYHYMGSILPPDGQRLPNISF